MSRFSLQQEYIHDKQIQQFFIPWEQTFNSVSVIYIAIQNVLKIAVVLYISSSLLPHSDNHQDVNDSIVKEPDYSSAQGNSACNTYT